MRVRKTCLISLLGIALWISSLAAASELPSTGRWIVRLSTPLEESWSLLALGDQVQPLNVDLGLYLISPAPHSRSLSDVEIAMIKDDWAILYSQEDFLVQPRTAPNDPQLDKQWALSNAKRTSHIHAQIAWRKTTGGKTALGDEIVVAIVDDGVDIDHIDLAANIWVNPHEIAGNGIDDDSNGYVDDVNGYNSDLDNGDIPNGDHGTHVAGIVGAVGDNNELISGVNWNVKIMPVYYGYGATSDVILSYSYVLEQKKRWIQSEGREGANVVATNSSFGHNFADCTSGEYPAWDDLYNEMGKVGILSAVATMNINADVDEKGDVPSGCLSPFLIKVTNTDRRGRKAYSAAYGLNMVDIGAPGSDIHSTLPRNRAGSKSGTSMATPHVTGAIALTHAAASRSFAEWYRNTPDQAALHLKEILLTSVTPLDSLKDKTRTGGMLNVGAAVDEISRFRK